MSAVPKSDHSLSSLVDVALQIAEERAKILGQMKKALIEHDDKLALKLAKQLCGIDNGRTH